MKPINPAFYAALYTLWQVSKQYRDAVANLDDLQDRGNPDSEWNTAIALARAEVTTAYRSFCYTLAQIEHLQQHYPDDIG